MAVSPQPGCKKLIWVLFCILVFVYSSCSEGAVERDIVASRELHRRVRSSFYLLGYCSDPDGPKCGSLKSLLEWSEALTRDSSIKTGLVVFDAAYWQTHLNSSTPIHLWFACYNGQHTMMKSISSVDQAAAATWPGSPSAARTATASAVTTDCSPGVPFYACPQLPLVFKTDLLMSNLAAAVQQQGVACIAGQVRNMHPAAAAALDFNAVLQDAATAADLDPDSVMSSEAFLRGLDMYDQRVLQRQEREWLLKKFAVAALCAVIFLPTFVGIAGDGENRAEPLQQTSGAGVSEEVKMECMMYSLMLGTISGAAAVKWGMDILLVLLRKEGSVSWWWACPAWLLISVGVMSLVKWPEQARCKAPQHCITPGTQPSSVAVGLPIVPVVCKQAGAAKGRCIMRQKCNQRHDNLSVATCTIVAPQLFGSLRCLLYCQAVGSAFLVLILSSMQSQISWCRSFASEALFTGSPIEPRSTIWLRPFQGRSCKIYLCQAAQLYLLPGCGHELSS